MSRLPVVLVCDDDPLFHQTVKHNLKGRYEVRSAYDPEEAAAIVRNHHVALVLLDVSMRTDDDGLVAIPDLRELNPDLHLVMSSGRTDFSTVREALRRGAHDFVPKDFDPAELELTIERTLRDAELGARNRRQGFEIRTTETKHPLLGASPAMEQLRRLVEKVRPSYANVVITGETGVGKEVVARQLRKTLPDGSPEPFVAVDSSTIQSSLAESYLFGHEKGAFTGADALRRGVFEEADGGVVYFDELGNMSLEIQAKLLRVLQEKEIRRVGGTKTIPLEFRVIAATNQPLEQLVAEGRFKADLLQRLLVLPIAIPPLRERREDIPVLAAHFLARTEGRPGLRFSPAAAALLERYAWPGNVRELGNLMAYVSALGEGEAIEVDDLPPKIRDQAPSVAPADGSAPGLYAAVEAFERDYLAREIARHAGSVAELAARLGVGRSHLYAKLKKYGLQE